MIGLFGGTFNPVHNGHIQLAQQLLESFSFQEIEFLPCHIPVHRDLPQVSPEQRKQMVELAIQPFHQFSLNSLELDRGGSSYAIDTLRDIKSRHPDTSLCWLMGGDSFNSFSGWKNPQGILELAHLIVCPRPGVEINRQQLDHNVYLKEGESLHQYRSGKVVFQQMPANHCASTRIRQQLKNGEPVGGCLSPPVLNFILQNHLYES